MILDNRDVGRSSAVSTPYTIADMADDLAGLLDALEIQQTHVSKIEWRNLRGDLFGLGSHVRSMSGSLRRRAQHSSEKDEIGKSIPVLVGG